LKKDSRDYPQKSLGFSWSSNAAKVEDEGYVVGRSVAIPLVTGMLSEPFDGGGARKIID
jgi:hypothetical protein